MRKIFSLLSALVLLLGMGSCQSIEDTYEEWRGDGPIQYLNKIYDLHATPQWQAVKLDWHLIPDASRTAVLVECMTDADTVTYTLGKDDSAFVVKDLNRDYDYEFLVSAIRQENGEMIRKSLGDPIFAKPFSMESDEVKLFTHVVNKHIQVNGKKLFVTFDLWSDNLQKFSIGYFEKGASQETRIDYTREESLRDSFPDGKPWALIGNNIDFAKPVTVYRTGEITTFGNMVLDLTPLRLNFDAPSINSDFAVELMPQMGVSEITFDNAKGVSNIDLNYDLSSLEDILYFTNLKTVNLGPNRYLMAGTETTVKSRLSSNTGREISLGALEVAKKEMGVKINQFGHHYFDQAPDFFDGKNLTAKMPDVKLENTTGWSITKTPADLLTFGRDNILLDDDTYWIPAVSPSLRVHVFTIEFGSTRNITGFKFRQANVSQADIKNTGDYYFWPAPVLQLPSSLTVEIQDTNNNWVPAGSERTMLVGNGAGETTLIWFNRSHTPVATKRIRLTVSDSDFGKAYYNGMQTMFQRTALGTFIPTSN
jgi:hypothetical protein